MGHPSRQNPQALQPLGVLDLVFQSAAFLLGGAALGDVPTGHQHDLAPADPRPAQAGLHPQQFLAHPPEGPLQDSRLLACRAQLGQGPRSRHQVLQGQPVQVLPPHHPTGAAIPFQDHAGGEVVQGDAFADRVVDGLQPALALPGRLLGGPALGDLAHEVLAELGLLGDVALQVVAPALQLQVHTVHLLASRLELLEHVQKKADHLLGNHHLGRKRQVMQPTLQGLDPGRVPRGDHQPDQSVGRSGQQTTGLLHGPGPQREGVRPDFSQVQRMAQHEPLRRPRRRGEEPGLSHQRRPGPGSCCGSRKGTWCRRAP